MTKRRVKGDGGLVQRHDHPTCPSRIRVGADETGEAIWDRPDHKCQGRWVGTLDAFENGRRRRKYVYGRTQREAKAKLDKALQQRRDGTLVVASTTVEKWMDYWLDNIAAPRLKQQTLREYRAKVRLYIVPQLGSHRLTSLQPAHIRSLYGWMRDDGRADGEGGLAEATVRQTHAILRKALKDAVNDGKLAVNPVERVDAPGTEKNPRKPLVLADARRVLKAADDDARWWLALFYGLRQGEALGLRWCDVDFDQHTLRIAQALGTDEAYRITYGPPKSRASRRTIPLLPRMEARLRLAWTDAGAPTQEDRCSSVTGQCGHGLVFTYEGRPIWPNKDWEAWRDLLAASSVGHVALHAARNSAASLLEEAGVPERLVMQILGHSQVQITRGYQSADLDRMRQAFEAYDGIIGELD